MAATPPLVSLGASEHAVQGRNGRTEMIEVELFYELNHPARFWTRQIPFGVLTPIFSTEPNRDTVVKHPPTRRPLGKNHKDDGTRDPDPVQLGTISRRSFGLPRHLAMTRLLTRGQADS